MLAAMDTSHNPIIPLDPLQRRAWVNYQLQLRGLSLAELARRLGVSRHAPGHAFRRPYPRMERALAEAIGCTPQQLWPERFHADGTRRLAKPGPKPGRTRIRKDTSGPRRGNDSARKAG